MRRFGVILSASLMAVAAYAAVQEAVTFKWTPKVGETLKYKLTMDGNVAGQTFQATADLTSKTVEVKKDGSVVVQETFKMDMMGMPIEETSTTTYSAIGEIVERKSNSEMDNPRFNQANLFLYPKAPVKPGETWEHQVKGNQSKGTFDAVAKFTFKGVEKLGEKDAYRIDHSYSETNAPTNMTVSGSYWMDPSTGQLIKGSYEMKNAEFGPGVTGDMKGTINLVK